MKQTDVVIKHLSITGSISNREAILEYGIASLTKVISTLRKDNYKILGTWRTNPITLNRYKRYWVMDKKDFKELKYSDAAS